MAEAKLACEAKHGPDQKVGVQVGSKASHLHCSSVVAEDRDDDWSPSSGYNSQVSPRRVLSGFEELLDLLVNRTARESAVLHRLLREPDQVRVFVSHSRSDRIYHKAVLYLDCPNTNHKLTDKRKNLAQQPTAKSGSTGTTPNISNSAEPGRISSCRADQSSGGGVFCDTTGARVFADTHELDEIVLSERMQEISAHEIASNWIQHGLHPHPDRQLERRWLQAFTSKRTNNPPRDTNH
jgi:hypothetical protein